MNLAVITASTDPTRAKACLRSWQVPSEVPLIVVVNRHETFDTSGTLSLGLDGHWVVSPEYLGTVPAFRLGVDYALEQTTADILICLHDDVEILEPDWLTKVSRLFETHPCCGLAGFSGAIGLGDADIYQKPYDPMQLARIGFRSNLVDAEVHGIRSLLSEQVACCDGFSLVGRREFFEGHLSPHVATRQMIHERPWSYFEDHGLVHHAYDSLFGAYAKRLGWETWYLPVRCRHYGGQTAVADRGYQAWAQRTIPGGDTGFWQQSHKIGHTLFKDVLPIRV